MAIDFVKTKNGKPWRARIRLKTGKRITKCFQRKIDAQHWEAKVKIENADPQFVRREPIRFSALGEQFLKYQKGEIQPSTFKKYEGHLKKYLLPYFGNCLSDQITKIDVMNFKAHINGLELSNAVKHQVFSLLKTIFRRSMELDLINRDPAQAIRAPKKGGTRMEYWSEIEVNRFLFRMQDHPRYLLYLIALNTGMRAGEIFGLKWDCVDFGSRLITVRRTFDQKTLQLKETTKTHKSRRIGMNQVLIDALSKLSQNDLSAYVINREKMKCYNPAHVTREFTADCNRVGVRPIKFHDLRHTFATQFVGKGGSIHALAGVLGHQTTAMTERYAHFTPEHAVKNAEVVSFGAKIETKVVQLHAVE